MTDKHTSRQVDESTSISTIFITGGHATPAVACIHELQSRGLTDLIYIGQKKSILFDKNYSSEYKLITEKIQIPFKSIIAGKLSTYFTFSSFVWLLRFPIGFIQAFWWQITLRPSLVLTFGSHVGVPIVFWAWVFRTPIIAHEQTTSIGRANAFIQKLADKVCLSWPDSSVGMLASQLVNLSNSSNLTSRQVDKRTNDKYMLTGNPIRKEILEKPEKPLFEFSDISKKTILITGGNQGAHSLNLWIFENLESLLSKYNVIHQTGSNTLFNDFEKAKELATKLNRENLSYIPKDYIFTEEWRSAIYFADFVISRAGANTLIELAILRKKSLLIPIPTTSGNEQFLNAKFIADLGLAIVLDQNSLEEVNLVERLEGLESLKVKENYVEEFAKLHLGAEKRIVDLVEEIIDKKE